MKRLALEKRTTLATQAVEAFDSHIKAQTSDAVSNWRRPIAPPLSEGTAKLLAETVDMPKTLAGDRPIKRWEKRLAKKGTRS